MLRPPSSTLFPYTRLFRCAPSHGGMVQRQCLGGIYRDLAAIHRRAVDRAVAGDLDCAIVGERAAGDGRVMKIEPGSRVNLNKAGIANADSVERRAQG